MKYPFISIYIFLYKSIICTIFLENLEQMLKKFFDQKLLYMTICKYQFYHTLNEISSILAKY